MNARFSTLLVAIALFGGLSSAYALETGLPKTDATPSTSATVAASRHAALFGSPALQAHATRTITLGPDTRYINVKSGETVAFRSGGTMSAWTFTETISGKNADLALLMPELPDAKGIRVYIDRSDLFTGG